MLESLGVFLFSVQMQAGVAVALVFFQERGEPPSFMEYRVEGCQGIGDKIMKRGGFTRAWVRNGPSVADQVATKICAKIEEQERNM
jgi:hypothetical protein